MADGRWQSVVWLGFVWLGCVSAAAEGVSGRVVLVGDPPPAGAFEPGPDACCQAAAPVDERVLVGPDGGLANVVVSVVVRGSQAELPAGPAPSEPAVLTNRDCVFRPRVLLARVGQPLVLENADPTMHNVNVAFTRNTPLNLVVEPDGRREIALDRAERKPAAVRCNVHSFMRGWVVVRDDAYAAVTDERGHFELPALPAGAWRLRFWHEGEPLAGLAVAAATTDRRGEATITVADEPLDLGEIEVPAESLR